MMLHRWPKAAPLSVLASLLVVGCETPKVQPADPPEASVEPMQAPSVRGGDRSRGLSTALPALVGTLTKNVPYSIVRPSEYCLDDGYIYRGAPGRIGDLNVFVERAVDELVGKVVLARGKKNPSLLSALDKGDRCPDDYGKSPAEMPQMRSDWVSPEGSFRPTRDRLRSLPCFEATELIAIDMGRETSVTEEAVTVTLHNPFDAPLDGVKAQAHYEGGPGKPMPRFEPITLKLPAGGTQELSLPPRVEAGPAGRDEGEPRGTYVLASIDLSGRVGNVELDVSLPVSVPRNPRKR